MVRKQISLVAIILILSTAFAYAAPGDWVFDNWSEDGLSMTTMFDTGMHQETITRTLQPINSHINFIQFRQSLVNAPETAVIAYETGLSAGDAASGLSLWSSSIYTDFEDDKTGSKYDGDGVSVSVGMDKAFMDGMFVSGLSLAYDDSETSSAFNNGGTDTDSFTISPYLSYMLNNTYGLDFSFGWGQGDTDMHRDDLLGVKTSGSQDSDHSFYSVGISGNHWLQNISLGWRLGYYYSKTNYDSYTETDTDGLTTNIDDSSNKIGQIAASVQAGYYLKTWMPYVKVTYENETTRSPSSAADDDGFVWELGANLFGSGPFSGGASISTKSGRGSYESISAIARLSYAF